MFGEILKMAEEMEDNNSWNELIFRQIRARKDWILALIWRRRLELEDDTAHTEVKNSDEKEIMDLEEEHPLFAKWCDERQDNFDTLLEERKSSASQEEEQAGQNQELPLFTQRCEGRKDNLDTLLEERKSPASQEEKQAGQN